MQLKTGFGNRLLSGLLAFVMVLSLVPTSIFAAEDHLVEPTPQFGVINSKNGYYFVSPFQAAIDEAGGTMKVNVKIDNHSKGINNITSLKRDEGLATWQGHFATASIPMGGYAYCADHMKTATDKKFMPCKVEDPVVDDLVINTYFAGATDLEIRTEDYGKGNLWENIKRVYPHITDVCSDEEMAALSRDEFITATQMALWMSLRTSNGMYCLGVEEMGRYITTDSGQIQFVIEHQVRPELDEETGEYPVLPGQTCYDFVWREPNTNTPAKRRIMAMALGLRCYASYLVASGVTYRTRIPGGDVRFVENESFAVSKYNVLSNHLDFSNANGKTGDGTIKDAYDEMIAAGEESGLYLSDDGQGRQYYVMYGLFTSKTQPYGGYDAVLTLKGTYPEGTKIAPIWSFNGLDENVMSKTNISSASYPGHFHDGVVGGTAVALNQFVATGVGDGTISEDDCNAGQGLINEYDDPRHYCFAVYYKVMIPVDGVDQPADFVVECVNDEVLSYNCYLCPNMTTFKSYQPFLIGEIGGSVHGTLHFSWGTPHESYYIQARKIDRATGQPISGAKLQVKNLDVKKPNGDDIIYSDNTDGDGYVRFEVNPEEYVAPDGSFRNWELSEISVPNPYILSTEKIQFKSNETGKAVLKNDKTIPQYDVIFKTDTEGKGLEGCVLEFTGISGDWVHENVPNFKRTTGVNGSIDIQWWDPSKDNYVEPGTYEVREYKAPTGYITDEETVQTISFDWNDYTKVATHTGPLKFVNVKKTNIPVYKKDNEGNYVAGVNFDVWKDGKYLGSIGPSELGGPIIFDGINHEGLDNGYYEFKEKNAAEGYLLSDEVQGRHVNVSKEHPHGTFTPVKFVNVKSPSITISKFDSKSGAPLAGGVYQVKVDGQDIFGNFVTNEDGIITIDEEKYGKFLDETKDSWTFEVTEVSPPPGYLLPPEGERTQIREVKRGTEHIPFTFLNDKYVELKIVKLDAQDKDKRLGGALFYISIDGDQVISRATDENGEIILKWDELGDFLPENEGQDSWQIKVEEITPPPGYLLPPPEDRYQIQTLRKGEQLKEFTFYDYQYPYIEIYKKDSETGLPVPGTTFDVQIDGHKLSGPFISNDEGYVRIDWEQYRDFLGDIKDPDKTWDITVTEINATENYNRDPHDTNGWTQTKPLNLGTKKVDFTYEDTHYRDIRVTKSDADNGWKLGGAKFKLHCVSLDDPKLTKPADREAVTADGTGIAIFENVPNGIYEITETQAPAGYQDKPVDFVKRVHVTSESERVIDIEIKNEPKAGLILKKKDAVDDQGIEGVEFEIHGYTNDGVNVPSQIYRTDANGIICIEDMEPGSYVATEVSVPDGYILDPTPHPLEVKDGHQSTYYEFVNNSKSALYILKLDSATGLPVPGVRFSVSTTGGTHIADVETGENGYARLSGLLPGGYVVKEIWCPNDMILDPTPQTFEVKEGDSGEIYELIFYNNEKTNLVLQKIDSKTREPLEGAYFTIRDDQGREILVNERTDENGLIILENQKPGLYIVEEIKAPDGYVLSSGEQRVYLEANKTKVFPFENEHKGGMLICKIDADTELPLGGATFTISKIDKSWSVTKYDDDKDGYVRIPELDPGLYVIEEIKAPNGYLLNKNPIQVSVTNNDVIPVTIRNKSKSMMTISKIDADTKKPLPGARFNIATMEGTIVKTGISDEHGKLILTGLEPGWYNVLEIQAPNGYVLNETPYPVQVKEGLNAQIEIPNTAHRGFWLEKLDAETNAPLPGAVFEIYTIDGKFINEYTTNTSGSINTEELAPGHYKIHEKKAPEGYLPDPEWKYFEMVEGETTRVTFRNWKDTVIRVEKYDSVTGKPLAGAVFEIRTADGKTVIGTYTTDISGTAYSLPLAPGSYVVEEIQAPDGYVLNKEIKTVNVEAGHMPEVVRFYNEQMEISIIKKIDSQTGEPLAGATFRLFNSDGIAIGEYTTEADGIVTLPALAPGMYSVQEIIAPEGYMIDALCRQIFEVKAGQHISLLFKDTKKPGIQIFKVDAATGDPLPGAVFHLIDEKNHVIKSETSDESGSIIFTNLDAGHYFIQEFQAPAGYTKDEDLRSVSLAAGETIILTFTNTKDSGLNIKKTDPQGNPLAGAVFTVTRKSDNKVLGRYTSDATGCLAVEGLEPGDYIVTEIIAPDGYVRTDESKTVTITKGEPGYVAFVNEKLTGIEILKLDAASDIPLLGASFEVRDLDGKLIGTYTTGVDGKAVTKPLKPGRYTVTETVAPDGYEMAEEVTQTVEVTTGEIAKVVFRNEPSGSLRVIKVDSKTGNPLSGATFVIYRASDMSNVARVETGSDGVAFFDNLPAATYIVMEAVPPAGYKVDKPFEMIKVTGTNTEITFRDTKLPGLIIEKIDAITKAPLAGASFSVLDAEGHEVFSGTTDSTGLVQTDALTSGTYTVKETKAPHGYSLNTEEKTVTADGKSITITFENMPLATLTINKVSGKNKEPLSGASFEVRAMDGSIVKNVTTDQSGLAFVSGLTEGAYQITETKAPNGYVLSGDHIDFFVAAGKDNTVTVENYMNPGMIIRKVDRGTGALLQGAKFSVENSNGEIAYTGTTDASGIIMTGPLEAGTYLVREISAPAGYLLDSEPQMVELHENETRTVEFADSPLTSILIEKIDSVSKEALPDARFKVTNITTKEVIAEGVTGVDGLYMISDMEPGRYLVEEVVAPKGYIMDTKPIIADVELGMVAQVTFFNTPMTGIIIDSIDHDSKEPLDGSKFEIWIQNGDKVFEGTTDSTGRIQTPALNPGFYVIKQTIVKNGYTVITKEQTVEVKAGTQPVHVTFEAQPGYTLRIENVDIKDADVTISKSEFTVTKIDGSIVGTYVTDVNGQIMIPGLEAGWYIVTNSKPGNGYVLNDKEFRVEVKAGIIATVVVRSTPLTGLSIDVLDQETKKPLADAVFQVYVQNGQLVGTFTSDVTGHIETEKLPEGYYVIKQIKAPNGYLAAEDQTVQVTVNSSSNVTFYNQKTKNVVIICNDNLGKPLAGIEVELKKQNGNVIGNFTTDNAGRIETHDLTPGYYEIKQIKVPDGFVLDTTVKTILVSTEESVIVRFNTATMSTITVTLKDSENNKPLKGAEFTVTERDGGLVGTFVTDANGMFETNQLKSGFYLIKQIKAATGYLMAAEQTVQVVDNQPTKIIITNEHTKNMVIICNDSEGKPLAGVEIEVKKQNGEIVGIFTSDAAGRIETNNLVPGYYEIKQTKVPDGFVIDNEIKTVYVSTDTSITVRFNTSAMSKIIIACKDDKNNALAGAEFTVSKQNGGLIGTYVTAANGMVETELLPSGFYVVKQTKAVNGYLIAEEKTIEVVNNTPSTVVFTNEKTKNMVIICKDNSGNPLANVEVELKKQNGEVIGKFTTDSSGRIEVPNMIPGYYEIKQTKVPDGFVLDSTSKVIEITTDASITVRFNTSAMSKIVISCKDSSNKALAGAEFTVSKRDGGLIGTYVTKSSGTIETELLPSGFYVVKQVKAPNGYVAGKDQVVQLMNNESAQVLFTNEKTKNLIIICNDNFGKPLAGVEVELKKQNGDVVGHFTSDAAGHIQTPDLAPGHYEVKQIKVPAGFVLDTSVKTVEITTKNSVTIRFTNASMSKIVIACKTMDSKALEGAEFTVTERDGGLVGTYVTNSTGMVETELLPSGFYIVKQTKAPNGYLVAEQQIVQLMNNNAANVVFQNAKTKNLTIICNDNFGSPLAGVEVEVKVQNGEIIGHYTSDKSGSIKTPDLAPGFYEVKQIKVPAGFVIDNSVKVVEITTQSSEIVRFVNSAMSKIMISCKDNETNAPLMGAEFSVFKRDGDLVGTYVTKASGMIETELLPSGSYEIKQTKAPEGYMAAEDQVIQLMDNAASQVVFRNTKTKNVVIICNDSFGNPLANVGIEVKKEHGDVVGNFVSDNAGRIETGNLKPGYYEVKMTKVPSGYTMDTEVKSVYVSTESAVTVRFNTAAMSNIIISCVDGVTNKALAGAQFTITKQNGGLVDTYTTDASGRAESKLLESGYYVIKQVKAADGYVNDGFEQTIFVSVNDPVMITVKNNSMSNITLTYEDSITGTGVAGAVFDVSQQNGKFIGEFTTEDGGSVSTPSLEPGYYTVKLKSAPKNYAFMAEERTVQVSNGLSSTVVFKGNSTSSMSIQAMTEDHQPLAYVSFVVKNMDNSEVGTFMTDISGTIMIADLAPGFYRVSQTAVPDGYELNAKEEIVEVKAGNMASISFVNKAHTGAVIYTVDAKGNPVIGVRFEVKEQNGNVIGTYLSDNSGMINVKTMKPGYYEISILNVPDGYTIENTKQTVQVTTDGTVRLTFNAITQGTIKIHLTDATNGLAIMGAKFKVTELGGNVIGEYVTDNTGYVVSDKLNPGFYVVSQIGTANGYVFNTESRNVEVKSGSAVTVDFSNDKYSEIVLKNLNKADESPLGGAHFRLNTIDGTLVAESIIVGNDGVVTLPKLNEGHYVLTQTQAPYGFSVNPEPLQFKVGVNEPTIITFYNQAQAKLQITSVDNSGHGLPGMKVTVSRLDNSTVGEFTTDQNGMVIVNSVEPGWYIVTETQAPAGYTVNNESQRVEVKANTIAQATFTHSKVCGLQILTTVTQTNQPLAGAVYTIEKLNGERMGTYTSDAQGLIYVNLAPDTYVVKQISLPTGYTVDSTARNITVGVDQTTQMNYTVGQLSSMRIHIMDAATGRGIYGMRFLLKNLDQTIIGEYTTNDQGYITLDRALADGYYNLELIYAPGHYSVDRTPRTIQILNGQTTEVNWTFSAEAGQIQVVVRSSDYNNMLDLPMDSLLSGATFEIYNPDTYVVVDTIVSGADGVAASTPLPIGRYIVRQKSGAPYFIGSDKELEVKLKVPNDVVRVEYYNRSANISLTNTIRSNKNVMAGSYMRVDFTAVNNASDTRLGDFFWHIKVPTDCARVGTLYTGSWNTRAHYTVSYKTNMRDYRKMTADLLSSNQTNLDFSSTSLGLMSGEYVTDIMVNFGQVPGNFVTQTAPALYLYVMPHVYNGYKCIVRSEIGGKIGNEWQTANATWTTNVMKSTNLPGRLPTTGF